MPPRRDTKEILILSLMRIVARYGLGEATISAIARESGVTQGAIYRHYRSKEELLWCAYKQTIEVMAQEKQSLVLLGLPLRETIGRWVKLTYEYFDRDPDAFTFVLLTTHPQLNEWDDSGITSQQGKLFMQLVDGARQAQQIRDISPELALTHFTGLMLNVPRLINEGVLIKPAMSYWDDVSNAVCQVLYVSAEC